jgi:hypothetical protein
MDTRIKNIWSQINKLAPLMRMTPNDYKFFVLTRAGVPGGSVKDLSSTAYDAVLKVLAFDAGQFKVDVKTPNKPKEAKKNTCPAIYVKDSPENAMYRKLLYFCHQMNWEVEGRADQERLDAWAVKFGKYNKKLVEHNHNELAVLLTQFENVYRSFLQGLRI